MRRFSNYWIFSAGLAIGWAAALVIRLVVLPGRGEILYVFAGFWISWVATTIARYVYPPPKRWEGRTW